MPDQNGPAETPGFFRLSHAGTRILCIGGAAQDRTLQLGVPLELHTSNIAAGRTSWGGVARNVAEGLARLGQGVDLVSLTGDDPSGSEMRARLAEAGVGLRFLGAEPGAATASYTAVLNPDGEMAVAFAEMGVLDCMTPDRLPPEPGDTALLFADCNLPAESLRALMARRLAGGAPLAVDVVSVAKSGRLPVDLSGISLLFANAQEAGALLGTAMPTTPGEALDAAAALCARGAGAAAIFLGAGGVAAAGPDGAFHVPPVPAEMRDATGAGDATITATLWRLAAGAPLRDALSCGARAGALTIERDGAVAGLDPALLLS
ncbi:PfkB family carbohydrate kinase [Roseicyclus sp. F158]|uniref:PfkB family carbohydrate kinase n=1 Tax=Tropicimonas omnivorans TaxID=3075590 RepID=A0ABU3DFR1_9RHOB|nr:PfkB family carbohydrate kinase [Roseicyclus sp. F158]MDT0682534.1 PfkB family carbohydrate kinase [Roseicyclus sp. F158]